MNLGGAQSGLVVTRQGEISLRGDRGGLVVTNQGVSLGGLIATRAGVSLGGAEGLVIARNGVRALGVDLIRTGPGPIATGSIGTVASIGTIPGLIPTQVVPAVNGGVRGVGGANTLSTLQLTPPELAQVTINQKAGRARERLVAAELRAQFTNASVQSERLLRDADGNKLIDKLSEEGRRIDLAVIENGKVLKLVEVTSLTANKTSQELKEDNIRINNDVFIRDRITRELINVNNVKTDTDRRN